MTDSFVTQCPHCHTSFRVSRVQLGAAHGAVRCGACLHVFNATHHLVGEQAGAFKPSITPQPAATQRPSSATPHSTATTSQATANKPSNAAQSALTKAKTTPAGKKPSDTLWIHDDLDLDSLDLDEELAKLEQEELQLSQEFQALGRAQKPAESLLNPREEEARDQHDERWAEELLKDEPPKRPAPPAKPAPTPAAPVIAPIPATQPPPAPRQTAPIKPAPVKPELDDEPEEVFQLSAERDEPDVDPLDKEEDDSQDEPLPTNQRQQKSARNEPPLHDESLFSLSEEPLQLDWRQPKTPWSRWLGWGLLNLLGAAALAGQYVWYHFDELARQDRYRPWFEQICPEIGCTLPSKVEISLIKSSNLVVRSHPEFAGALIVDAILYNRAPFAQPFPLLELRFADINGQLLASRRFKPGEYLGGELAGQSEMPPQTPIHVSLDILDPGIKAVNYSLSFHSPE